MAVKLSEAQLPELSSWLQEHLPQSLKIHEELKSHLRGQFTEMDFFVDRWPHPQAAIAVLNSSGPEFRTNRQFVGGVFGVKDEVVRTLLKDSPAVSWDAEVLLAALPNNMKETIMTLSQEMGKSVTLHPCLFMKATPQDLKPIPVPEGMKFRPIAGADFKIIHSTWRHNEHVPESYIEGLVQRFPSVCLALDNGQHVGHMMGMSDGTIGMLYVNPEFRKKGYAKVIVSHLSQKYFDQGDDAYVCIEDYNVSSQNLHASLGFKTVCDSFWSWFKCNGC